MPIWGNGCFRDMYYSKTPVVIRPWANIWSFSILLCVLLSGPFPSFLPHDFLFTIVVLPSLTPCVTLLFFYLLPSKPFPVIDALNRVRRPDWMEMLCLSDVTSILHSDRSPIVCRWTLSWNFIFLTVTSPTCSFMWLSLVLAQKTCIIFLFPLLTDTPVCSTLWL